jgi:hypothetical protein
MSAKPEPRDGGGFMQPDDTEREEEWKNTIELSIVQH